jgi:ABC-type bacteriocin/lantibiotic exporter with double-glycine peptidase domain
MENRITPVRRFFLMLAKDKLEIRNVYIYSVLNGLVSLSLPLGIQAIINLIQGGQISTSWVVLVGIVVAGIILNGLLSIYQLRITENLQQKLFTRAAFEFADRIPRIKMEMLYRYYPPELMNRFFDIVSIQKGLPKILIDLSAASLQVIFGLILLSLYHPFFIMFSIFLILLVYAIFRFTAKKGLQTSLEESKHKYKVAHWLEEVARTHMTFKLAGNTDLPLKKMDHYVNDYLNARESHFGILVRQFSLLVLFKAVVALGLLAIGGILVMEQLMNIGQFVAAEIIILLVINSVEKIILNLEVIYDVLTALEKVGQVTDLDLEMHTGKEFTSQETCNGVSVELRNVSFNYPDHEKQVLNQLNISIGCGEKWLIHGKNGSGKSTLLQVMTGIYELQQGNIMYNGIPKKNIDLGSLRSALGDSLSQEQLFKGTILENITMGRTNATFDNVQWAVRSLGLEEFIKSLKDGYETLVDPEGKKLPRSISQKILLARCVADKPGLIVVEEALGQIDDTERHRIIDFLTSPENSWTLVAVESDPYFAQKCDQIAIMENGKIVQKGTYSEMANHLTD